MGDKMRSPRRDTRGDGRSGAISTAQSVNPDNAVVKSRQITVTFYSSKTDTTPTERTCTFDQLAQRLLKHDRRHDKDGAMFSAVVLKPGTTRRNENVARVTALVFEVDSADYQPTMDRVRASGYRSVVYSTFSSTPQDPRWRLVVQTTRDVFQLEHTEICRRANYHILGGGGEDHASDISRAFYLPSCPPDGRPFAFEIPGRPLDPDELTPVPQERTRSTGNVTVNDTELIQKMCANPKYARLWDGNISDYPSASEADFALVCSLIRRTGHDLARADALFRQSGLYRPKWDEKHGALTYGEMSLTRADQRVDGGYDQERSETDPLMFNYYTYTAGPHEELEALKAEIRELRRQLAQVLDERRQLLAIEHNPKIREERQSILATVFAVQSAMSRGKADDDGWIEIYRGTPEKPGLAQEAGVSPQSFSRHLDRAASWGLIEKGNPPARHTKDGPKKRILVKLKMPYPELLRTMATLDPERPRRGRPAGRYCPDHPMAKLVHKETWVCSDCGAIVDEKESLTDPSFNNYTTSAVIDGTSSVGTTYMYHESPMDKQIREAYEVACAKLDGTQ